MIELSLNAGIPCFIFAVAVIALAGPRLAAVADRIADQTGLGEAITGSLFLGAATSLPGTVVVIFSAAIDRPEFALATAVGGIPAQSAFLGIADLAYRRANLEHAAASHSNMLMAALLLMLLAMPLFAATGPDLTIANIHAVTPLMVVVYVTGLLVIRRSSSRPMWEPRQTSETVEDEPDISTRPTLLKWSLLRFLVFGTLTGAAGWLMAVSALNISEKTGLDETIVGGIFVAISTSIPELVTAISAVRRGALTLAVADIIGGNAYDAVVLAVADISYRGGSIFHAAGNSAVFLLGWSILMSTVIMFGLLRRERSGFANIGLEGLLLIALFIGGAVVLTST